MVEMYGYDYPSTNHDPLKGTRASGVKHCLGRVHPRGGIDEACMDRRGVDPINLQKPRQVIVGTCVHIILARLRMYKTEGGQVRRLTHNPSIVVPSVHYKLLHVFTYVIQLFGFVMSLIKG